MRRRTLALCTLGLAVAAVASVSVSGAVLDSRTTSSGSVGASADWTPPTVSITGAAGAVAGTVAVDATASDAHSSVTSVSVEVRSASSAGAWTQLCTDTTSPYSCSWDTTKVTDGTYDVRALAVDAYANSTTSATVQRTVANTGPAVSIDELSLPDYLRGTVTVGASAADAVSGIRSVAIQTSNNGTSGWSSLCTDTTSPYSCSYATSGSGDVYLRAVATTNVGTTTTSAVVVTTVDNTAPTVTTASPGLTLSGTVSVTASASDTDSGIQSVVLQHQVTGSTTWTTTCTAAASPYTCRLDTTAFPTPSTLVFRSIATDYAGNTTTSTTTTPSTVNNTAASVSVEDPGQYLRGTVALNASANAATGQTVASVALQHAPGGTTTWTTVCTDTASPYSCSWDTTRVANATYDLRAVLTQSGGSTVTSATVTARTVDNTTLRALDVQGTNGGTASRVDTGDSLTYTYSAVVDPKTLVSGWDGAARPVGVRLRDGASAGGLGGEDVIDVFTDTGLGTAVKLGTVNTRGNFVKGKDTTWSGTLSVATTTVNGASVTRVTVVLGALATSDTTRTTKTARTLQWTPSSGAATASGAACSTAPVDESGTADRDF